MGTELASWIPAGVVIALIGGVFAVWQARVGIRPAEREGFRADFRELVTELKAENKELEAKIDLLQASLEETTLELRALGGYARELLRDYQNRNVQAPLYYPPPYLDKHLR